MYKQWFMCEHVKLEQVKFIIHVCCIIIYLQKYMLRAEHFILLCYRITDRVIKSMNGSNSYRYYNATVDIIQVTLQNFDNQNYFAFLFLEHTSLS